MVFHSQMGSPEDKNLASTGKRNDSIKYFSKLADLREIRVFVIQRQLKNCSST